MPVTVDGTNGVSLISSTSAPFLVGQVCFFGQSTAPSGFLKCDGSAVSRSTYANLFSAIGTTYGSGDGTSTFNVPDLRGEFVRAFDDGRGVDSGRTIGSTQTADIAPHLHTIGYTGVLGYSGGGGNPNTFWGSGTNRQTNNSTGTETRPRNVAMLACIKF